MGCEHFAQSQTRLFCFGSEHDAASIFIEPVDDPATRVFGVASEHRRRVPTKPIYESLASTRWCRMGYQPCWFYKAEDMFVLEQNF